LADGAVTSDKIADGAVTLSKISKTGASSGQVIQYDGSDITWGTPSGSGGGLELPFSGTASLSGSAFSIENTGNAIAAYSVHSSAVYGESENSANGMVAVYGVASSPSNDSISFAMLGENDGTGYYSIGSSGIVFGNGVGVYGYAPDEYAIGVWGDTDIGWAGMFSGAVGIEGDLQVTGAIVKGGGGFRIDHPLDPEGKYLNHAFVESSDMMNVYNGNVTLDANGEAWVELPEWFEALNKDFRYQLTCIGGFAPVYVDKTISGNRFKIAGGRPDLEVSWQVTGIRKDPFAEMQPIAVEQTKPAGERGTYLHPRAYGLPREMGADWTREKREIRKYREALKGKR
jgi:hypothetical protein